MNASNQKLRIIVLTTRLPEDIWLINSVADVCQIEGIVFPLKKRYKEYDWLYVLKKRIPRIGILPVINQALLVLYRFIFEKRRDRRALREIFGDKPIDYIEPEGMDILEVKDINSGGVRDFIKSKKPQMVVVSGAPILHQSIIEAAEGRIINLHPGYAPQYRGRYGSFWPVYNQEPEMVGATVHFVDAGVDTGAILGQRLVDYYPDDTLKIITYKQHKTGGELLVKILSRFDALADDAYHKTDCADKNYIAPGLTHYLKARRWLRKRYGTGKLVSVSLEQENKIGKNEK